MNDAELKELVEGLTPDQMADAFLADHPWPKWDKRFRRMTDKAIRRGLVLYANKHLALTPEGHQHAKELRSEM